MANVTGLRIFTLVAALGSVVACAGCSRSAHAGGASTGVARVGKPAPSWSKPAIPSGTLLSLASLRGKFVYLNFFASWCPPCNDEAASIEALQRRYGPQGLQVVGVDVAENAGKAEAFRDTHHLSYPVVVDDGTLQQQYGIEGLPVHVFIDPRGVVRHIEVGGLDANEIRDNVTKLLGE
jgi:cytochrome c biogenesis protein CcmG, thiol:disulfide interchange protein DsbE